MSYTLQRGRRYKATISLGVLESLASNAMVADRFTALGFSNVKVTGTGGTPYAEGVWNADDITVSMLPPQIAEVFESDV